MFVSHFIDSDLRVEIFFENKEVIENGGVDFEIRDIGTSAHLLEVEETFMQSLSALLFYCFFGDQNNFLKLC